MGTLHNSLEEGRYHQFTYLVKMDCRLEELDKKLHTPLIRVCLMDNVKMACKLMVLLIDRGANVLALDEEGLSILHIATKRNVPEMVKFIFSKVPDFSLMVKDLHGNCPLHYACAHSDGQIARVLVIKMMRYALDIDMRNNLGFTPLLIAASNGQLDIARYLISTSRVSVAIYDSLYFKTPAQWLSLYYVTHEDVNILSSTEKLQRRESAAIQKTKSGLTAVKTTPAASSMIGSWQTEVETILKSGRTDRKKSISSNNRLLRSHNGGNIPKIVITEPSASRPQTAPECRGKSLRRLKSAKSDGYRSERHDNQYSYNSTRGYDQQRRRINNETSIESRSNTKLNSEPIKQRELTGCWPSLVSMATIYSDQLSDAYRKTITLDWTEQEPESNPGPAKEENRTTAIILNMLRSRKYATSESGSGDEEITIPKTPIRNKLRIKLKKLTDSDSEKADKTDEDREMKVVSAMAKLLGSRKKPPISARISSSKPSDL